MSNFTVGYIGFGSPPTYAHNWDCPIGKPWFGVQPPVCTCNKLHKADEFSNPVINSTYIESKPFTCPNCKGSGKFHHPYLGTEQDCISCDKGIVWSKS